MLLVYVVLLKPSFVFLVAQDLIIYVTLSFHFLRGFNLESRQHVHERML
jgi:hypothetical protein